jgi:hypothetical protein
MRLYKSKKIIKIPLKKQKLGSPHSKSATITKIYQTLMHKNKF